MCNVREVKANIDIQSLSDQEAAEYLAKITAVQNLIEVQAEQIKNRLREKVGQSWIISESKQKVVVFEGREKSEINAQALGSKLIAEGRQNDLLGVISITQTKLNNLIDAQELVEKFKVVLPEKTAPSVQVKDLTKKELVEYKL